MHQEEGRTLADLTTFRVGGPVAYLRRVETLDDLQKAARSVEEHHLPCIALGEGSNLLGKDEGYTGVLLKMAFSGLSFEEEMCVAAAGVSCDACVQEAAKRGLWGIENLAGIPGTCGAAPIQNIGAYGTELKEVLYAVDAYDMKKHTPVRLMNEECAFGYRDSIFKKRPELLITQITLRLRKNGEANLSYADMAKAKNEGAPCATPQEVGDVVRGIRTGKFPDLGVYGTAGSFFKNPVVPRGVYEELLRRYPDLPGFPVNGSVKVPLAYILDHLLNMKGFRVGSAFLFEKQPLVVVVERGGTAHDVLSLSSHVEARVHEATGLSIEKEVRVIDS